MSPARPRIDIRVLGVVGVSIDGIDVRLSPVERNLVALLVASGPDGLDNEGLADGLWGERLPRSWSASLRNSISRLNAKVPEEWAANEVRLISSRSSPRKLEVETDAVDLWRLLDWAESAEVSNEPALLPGTPFSGCELTPRLRAGTEKVLGARQYIISRWEAAGEALPNQVLADVRELCREDPFNQTFVHSVARLHQAVNDRDGALRLLERTEAELAEIEAPLSAELIDLRDTLVNQPPIDRINGPGPVTAAPIHSPTIQDLASSPLAGRTSLLSELVSRSFDPHCQGIALHGTAGTGKTRLAAEVAGQLQDAGYHTAYVTADQDTIGSLRPFLDSFRGMRAVVEPYLERLHQPEVHSRCWTQILAYFESLYTGHPLCLVVDDLQWFDDQSRELLLSLCRASLAFEVHVIAVGRTRERSATWPGWVGDLGRVGVQEVKVRPLDRDSILAMIAIRRSGAGPVQASTLADQLLELSSGIPDVAEWLLDRVDPTTFEIPADEIDGTGYATMVNSLPDDVRFCGAVASLLGIRFNLQDLLQLMGQAREEAEIGIDRLLGDGLLLELPMPDEYRFLHVLAAEALSQTLSTHDQRQLHARAFGLFEDPRRQAWHAAKSVPLTDERTAAVALVAAARVDFKDGNYPGTARHLQRATELHQDSVGLEEEVLYLEALERSGMRAGAHRAKITTTAMDRGLPSLALAAAGSGLPDTEALEGDLERVALLRRLDTSELSREERIELNIHLSRQLLLSGRIDEARQTADLADREALTADEQARTWLAVQLPDGLGSTGTQPDEMPWIDRIESEELRARIRQATVINAIASGQGVTFSRQMTEHARMVEEHGLTQLQWFAKMFQVTSLTDQGDRDGARSISGAAKEFGLRAGLRVATGAYETQRFMWKFHEGQHGEFHRFFEMEGGATDLTGNIFFNATGLASRYAHGVAVGDAEFRRRALSRVALMCEEAESSAFERVVIGIIADVIAASGDRDLLERARDLLAPRVGSYLLVASAVASLGPYSGVLARVTTDPADRVDLLEQAVQEADRDKLPLWQLLGRLNLAAALASTDDKASNAYEEAAQLANTPWLTEILDLRRGRPERQPQ